MHWLNSDHSYAYHIAGGCKTPDEAHRVISGCLSRREEAVREYPIRKRQRELQVERLRRSIRPWTGSLRKEEIKLEIKLLTMHEGTEAKAYKAAQHECDFMRAMLEVLEPACRYVGKMPAEEAYQLAQCDERALLILERAHNGLLANDRVDTETLREAQSHPKRGLLAMAIRQMSEDRNLAVDTLWPYAQLVVPGVQEAHALLGAGP